MYTITLTDSTTSATMPVLNVPLMQTVLEGAVDVTTLDLNMYTDFFATKRLWTHRWAYMTESEFNVLKGFYDRQWTLREYPTITIADLAVTDVVVRLNISPQSIIDNCGTVADVEATFRESVQTTSGGSS
jgi:hypothetical protein